MIIKGNNKEEQIQYVRKICDKIVSDIQNGDFNNGDIEVFSDVEDIGEFWDGGHNIIKNTKHTLGIRCIKTSIEECIK